MFWFFLYAASVLATPYDWARLHSCIAPDSLKETVADYVENFPLCHAWHKKRIENESL